MERVIMREELNREKTASGPAVSPSLPMRREIKDSWGKTERGRESEAEAEAGEVVRCELDRA